MRWSGCGALAAATRPGEPAVARPSPRQLTGSVGARSPAAGLARPNRAVSAKASAPPADDSPAAVEWVAPLLLPGDAPAAALERAVSIVVPRVVAARGPPVPWAAPSHQNRSVPPAAA